MKSFKILLLLVSALFTAQPVLAQVARAFRDVARNPLLRGVVLPRYAEIKPEHVAEAVQRLVQLTEEKIAVIENDEATDFVSLSIPLEEIYIYYSRIWSPIEHMFSVNDSEALREAYEQALPEITRLGLQLQQNPVIYRKLLALKQDTSLNAVQQRIVTLLLNDARATGIALSGAERERFNAISEELAQLGAQFANNNLDSIKEFQLILHNKEDCDGLPTSVLQRAAQSYQQVVGEDATANEGPWLFTLDASSYLSFMGHSSRRDLRKKNLSGTC